MLTFQNPTRILFLFIYGIFFFFNSYAYADKFFAEKGVLDLREWDFSSQGAVTIDGEWSFYPEELIDPKNPPQPSRYLSASTVWGDGNDLPQHGYASYALRILLPEDETTLPVYALKLGVRHAAYEIYADGVLLVKNGTVGKTKNKTRLRLMHYLSYLSPQRDGYIDLVVHYANFTSITSQLGEGDVSAIEFGKAQQFTYVKNMLLVNNSIVLAILLFVSAYYFVLSLLSQKTMGRGARYFSLTNFLYGMLILGHGTDFGLFGNISWEFNYRLFHILSYLLIFFLFLYMNDIFTEEFSGIWFRMTISILNIFVVFFLLLPISFLEANIYVSSLATGISLLLLLVNVVRAAVNHRPDAHIVAIGLFMATVTGVMTVLLAVFLGGFWLQVSSIIARYGFLAFIASLALVLIRRSARTDKELAERKKDLEQASIEIASLNSILRKENLRMGGELKTTQRLQELLLPKDKELNIFTHVDVAAAMLPANEVGGDYYDVLLRDSRSNNFDNQSSLTIGIGDVTGHGLESGMIMLMTQMGIKTLLSTGNDSLEKITNILNQNLYDNIKRMDGDKTLTLGLLNYDYDEINKQGQVQYCGQHETLLVIKASGKIEEYDTMELGFPLALQRDIEKWLRTLEITLFDGDSIVLYTDGITEAENAEHELYGLERLKECLKQNSHKNVDSIRNAVVESVRAFVDNHEMYDDVTLVILKQV